MVNILVVEDERLIAGLLKETLEIEGYQTVTILNGEDAVQFACHETPHLIVLDLMLPGIDGYEVIRRLREHPKCMHIPIIVLSAFTSTANKVRAFDLGVDGYITKPFSTDELLACVRRQLSRVQQNSLSPLTKLPGGLQLERAIHYKLNSSESWSILYLDLDNFKAFNDSYGFLAGNDMILLVSRICQHVVYHYGNTDDFVGHVGGDDFVIVTTPERAPVLCDAIVAQYKAESVALYTQEDRASGKIYSTDRSGRPSLFPLVSLSVGIVSNQQQLRPLKSVRELSSVIAEAKHTAKNSSDNICYLVSQRGRAYRECALPKTSPLSALYPSFSTHNYAERADYQWTLFPAGGGDVVAEYQGS